MSMGKQNLDNKCIWQMREFSGSKFHSVTSSNVILPNDVKNSIFYQKWIYLVLELSSSIMGLHKSQILHIFLNKHDG